MELNYFSPAEVAAIYSDLGVKKAGSPVIKQFVLAIMAGVFVAFAAQGFNAAIHTIGSVGIAKTVGGTVFTAALMIVNIAGGELFTGNCLMVIALAEKRISAGSLLRSWVVVYIGNLLGCLLIVFFVLHSGQFDFSDGMLGAFTIKTAVYKSTLSFGKAFFLGIMCNTLVCTAMWMAQAAKDIAGKVLAIFFPIWLFVVSGFEHSIANMYFIPAGILAGLNPVWAAKAANLGVTTEQIAALGAKSFLLNNLLPVTLGNLVGGSVLIGFLYWLVYLAKGRSK